MSRVALVGVLVVLTLVNIVIWAWALHMLNQAQKIFARAQHLAEQQTEAQARAWDDGYAATEDDNPYREP